MKCGGPSQWQKPVSGLLGRMRSLGALAFGLFGWLAVGTAAQPEPTIVFILADDPD